MADGHGKGTQQADLLQDMNKAAFICKHLQINYACYTPPTFVRAFDTALASIGTFSAPENVHSKNLALRKKITKRDQFT